MKFHVGHFSPMHMEHEVTIYEEGPDKQISYVSSVTLEAVKPNVGVKNDAGLSMYPEEVQQLFDDLWKQGFRPSQNYESGEGHLETLKKHTDRLSGWLDKFIVGSKEL